jgi:crotonobetainyl-CoA:carnitine CoA-transferase CaiB-like acyl-CoA transferase
MVRQVRSPVNVGSKPPPHRRAPRRHEDADDILRRVLGYDASKIERLSGTGAFGRVAP